MISAAHGVTMEHGDIVLSHRLLEKIYLAMDALANRGKTLGSPVEVLHAPGCERLREWCAVGPAQLAAFEEAAALLIAAERERCVDACEASYHWTNGPEGWLQYAVDAIRSRRSA